MFKFLSLLHVTICVDKEKRFEMLEAVDALAQMPRLRHLLFETTPEAELGWTVAACLRRMPVLRRCGRRIDLNQFYYKDCKNMAAYLKVHMDALKEQVAASGPPFQLEEAFFCHTSSYIADPKAVVRMPNLRTLALCLLSWHPSILILLQNVTELSLFAESRPVVMQVLAAVGHQLQKVTFMKV